MTDADLLVLRSKGLSIREISRITNIPKSTVCDRLRKLAGATENFETVLKQIQKSQNIWNILGERLIEAAQMMGELKDFEPKESNHELDEETWVHLISDVHVGHRTEYSQVGGLGNFNAEVFAEEVKFYAKSFKDISRYHVNTPSRGVVFFLGDIIEGSTIFFGQQRSIDLAVVKQVLSAIEQLTWLVNEFLEVYRTVDIYAVVGNHGRIGKKGELDPLDNLDYLVYKWLEERFRTKKNVNVHVSETWFQLVDIQKKRFLLIHGEDVPPGFLGISFYGVSRAERRWQEMLKDIGGFDYLVLGHHHQPAMFGNVLMNSSWVGGSEFSIKKLNLATEPSQKLFAVHPHWGVTWVRDIKLRENIKDVKIYGGS